MAKAKPIRGIDPQAPLFYNAALIIGARLSEMLVYEPYLNDPSRVYELHQMRIAAKRLRYTLEMFQDAYDRQSRFGKTFATATEQIRALQEHLGEIHDADVLVPQLLEHLARLLRPGYGADKKDVPVTGVHFVDFDACEGLLTLCKETRAYRDKRYRQLLSEWQKMQEEAYFKNLRVLLRDAMVEQALEIVEAAPATPAPETTPDVVPQEETAADGKDLSAPTEKPAARQQRSGKRARPARNSGGHSGSGADSGPGVAEGGAG